MKKQLFCLIAATCIAAPLLGMGFGTCAENALHSFEATLIAHQGVTPQNTAELDSLLDVVLTDFAIACCIGNEKDGLSYSFGAYHYYAGPDNKDVAIAWRRESLQQLLSSIKNGTENAWQEADLRAFIKEASSYMIATYCEAQTYKIYDAATTIDYQALNAYLLDNFCDLVSSLLEIPPHEFRWMYEQAKQGNLSARMRINVLPPEPLASSYIHFFDNFCSRIAQASGEELINDQFRAEQCHELWRLLRYTMCYLSKINKAGAFIGQQVRQACQQTHSQTLE